MLSPFDRLDEEVRPWATVDSALRWLNRTRPKLKAFDPSGVHPDNQLRGRQITQHLRSQMLAAFGALDELSSKALFHYAHGMSYPEVARELGISSPHKARRMVVKARAQVASRLRALGLLEALDDEAQPQANHDAA